MGSKADLELLAKGLALAGFIFTAFTYAYDLRVDRQERRYNEAKALIGQYAEAIWPLENELTQRLYYYTIGDLDLNDPQIFDDGQFELIARETLFGTTGENGSSSGVRPKPFVGDLARIIDFYEQVDFCLSAGMCASEVAGGYFCPRARSFAQRFDRLITYYYNFEGSEDWSNAFDRLLERCGQETA